jgi:hypothetical protein
VKVAGSRDAPRVECPTVPPVMTPKLARLLMRVLTEGEERQLAEKGDAA